MQNYLRHILDKEELLARPVFQNMFPWEPFSDSFGQLKGIFTPEFANRLDGIKNEEYRFPSDRKPYLHQVKSWHLSLNEKKSTLVTTGTGSGKTECFMLPVLQDIFTHNPNGTGVNAIFLYPLNALIGSQKKRMHEWCQALGNINYAVYNGNTKENVPNATQAKAYPEVISRVNIRSKPPQILFTNPTMLEYMLVRDKDTQLLQNSKGKLKWILLDEAHTLTGSKAAEMALLIRRVIDAFDVDINNMRFAVTSATVGDGNDDSLKQFMADLCGIQTSNIEIIKGKRLLPVLDTEILKKHNLSIETAVKLRTQLYQKPCLDSSDIEELTLISSLPDQLAYIDILADISDNGQPVLPVRGHFFARNISGIYACTNPNCTIHKNIPKHIIGSLTTISKKQCECGSPLLELIACRTCGTYMMEGERENNFVKQSSKQNNDFFQVENDDDEDNQTPNTVTGRFILARQFSSKPFISEALLPVQINDDGSLNFDTQGPLFEVHNSESCPYCGDSLEHPFHFRLSAAFLNRMMSDVILEQTENANPVTKEMLWGGKKYISFTDSRQGTAKISALINIDSETFWLRSQVFHFLCIERSKNQPTQLNEEECIAYTQELEKLKEDLQTAKLPIIISRRKEQIKDVEAILDSSPATVQQCRITWQQMLKMLARNENDFGNLFFHNVGGNRVSQGEDYLNSLLYNEFARRLPRERSLENLGMVNLVYPRMDNLVTPTIAKGLGIGSEEWKSLVKIALDYVLRYKFHYSISSNVRGLASTRHKSFAIYPSDTLVVDVLKWPVFERQRARPNRLALLICAGLGFHDSDTIDSEIQDQINELLESLWMTVRGNFLILDGNEGGYKLDLEEKAALELADTLWLCPVKKRLIDTTFKGYSPWINGKLTASNIDAFKVGEPVKFPMFPYPFNLDASNVYNTEPTLQWMASNSDIEVLRNGGLWSQLHERIINFKPLYLAGEHSAQQQQTRLDQLEARFQDGKINILSCSTTMEMGVDIGGISAVVMSNVPPSPANYLQRTGRAGRRRENKSLAFTICAANPIGTNVIANPKWALNHRISAPTLAFISKAVVQRHLNAFMFGKFIQQQLAGINVQETIENFFSKNLAGHQLAASQLFLEWLIGADSIQLSQSIKQIARNTPLTNNTSAAIINKVYSNFEVLLNVTNQKKESFNNVLNKFLTMPGYSEDSPAYKAVNYQKNQFLHKNLLAYLSEEGFLPAGGIPTGVVDFNNINIADLKKSITNSKQLPSYHITRALSEYAPGMKIVIDGWNYKSAGISLKNNWGGEASKKILQHCTACGNEQIIEQSDGPISTKCPYCLQNTMRGIRSDKSSTEIIEPAGFAVDLFEDKTREIDEHSNVQYVQPLLVGVEPWSDATHPLFEFRDSKENAEIINYNYGTGDGYSVCLECGRADANPIVLNGHTRLRGGKNADNNAICIGNDNPYAIRNNVLLVGRFQTDFFEIRCKDANGQLISNETILYSLGQVISKCLTTFLGIEEQEVDFGVKNYRGFSSIFLFDTAKGGAGYVSQCANYFEEICTEALAILERCTCRSACTKCLIDRKSQYHIDKLDRHSAIEWLKRMVDNKVPNDIAALLTNQPKKTIGTLKNDWARLMSKKLLQQVWLLVDFNDIDNWNAEDFLLLNQMKINDITINLVFRCAPVQLTIEQKLTLVQTKAWAQLHYTNDFSIGHLQQIARVKMLNKLQYDFYANNFHTQLDADWGNAVNNYVYKQEATEQWILHPLDIQFDGKQGNVFEVMIPAPASYIKSASLYTEFHLRLQKDVQQRLVNTLNGKDVHITYSDRYLMTPVGCLLFVQFIHKMKEKLGFGITGLTVRLKGMKAQNSQPNGYITEQFSDEDSRKKFIETIAGDCVISNVRIEIDHNLPHYRFLTVDAGHNTSVTIRPDAGIEHGWFVRNRYDYTDELYGTTLLDIQQKLNQALLYTLVFN